MFAFTLNCADLVWLLFCDFFFPWNWCWSRCVFSAIWVFFLKINYMGDNQSSNIFCIRQTVNSSHVLVQVVVLNQFTRPFFFFGDWKYASVWNLTNFDNIVFQKKFFWVCSEALLWGTLSLIPVGYIICWIDEYQ